MAVRECVLQDPSLRLQPPLTKGPMLWFNRIDSHGSGASLGSDLFQFATPRWCRCGSISTLPISPTVRGVANIAWHLAVGGLKNASPIHRGVRRRTGGDPHLISEVTSPHATCRPPMHAQLSAKKIWQQWPQAPEGAGSCVAEGTRLNGQLRDARRRLALAGSA